MARSASGYRIFAPMTRFALCALAGLVVAGAGCGASGHGTGTRPLDRRSSALYTVRQVEAAFATHGIRLERDHEPRWPPDNVRLLAPHKAYVEMVTSPSGTWISPPPRLLPAHARFTQRRNVQVWWSPAERKRVEAALAALGR